MTKQSNACCLFIIAIIMTCSMVPSNKNAITKYSNQDIRSTLPQSSIKPIRKESLWNQIRFPVSEEEDREYAKSIIKKDPLFKDIIRSHILASPSQSSSKEPIFSPKTRPIVSPKAIDAIKDMISPKSKATPDSTLASKLAPLSLSSDK